MMPVPATRIPAPKPVLMVVVMAAALPSASTTETCAVPWSGTSAVFCAVGPSALSALRSAARRGGARSAATGTRVNSGSPYQRARSAKPCAMAPARRWSAVGVPRTRAGRSSCARSPSTSSNTPPEPGGGEVFAVLDLAREVARLGERESVAREANGRCEHARERQAAEAAVERRHARHLARHADGEPARAEERRLGLSARLEVLGGGAR